MSIIKNVQDILQHIQALELRYHREPHAVQLLAVSKGQSVAHIATAAGLILYGSTQRSQGDIHIPVLSGNLPIKGMIQKGISLFKSFLP